MVDRNGIFSVVALALGSFALAAVLYTDAYTHAAQAEASAYDALTLHIAHGDTQVCVNNASLAPVPQ
ncbi:hypothetical protein AAKU55_003325 [Oxalobacteraceae bacterium GrIS 1.11]